jgi:hypothetical protein
MTVIGLLLIAGGLLGVSTVRALRSSRIRKARILLAFNGLVSAAIILRLITLITS